MPNPALGDTQVILSDGSGNETVTLNQNLKVRTAGDSWQNEDTLSAVGLSFVNSPPQQGVDIATRTFTAGKPVVLVGAVVRKGSRTGTIPNHPDNTRQASVNVN